MRYLIFALLCAMAGGMAQAQTTNIRTSVTGTILADRPNIRGDFKVGEKMTVGVELGNQSYDDSGVNIKGYSGGLYATLYTKGAFTRGWTVDFGLTYAKLTGEVSSGRKGEVDSVGFRVLGGYHWFWDPLNLSLGFGYASNSEDKLRVRDASGTVIAQGDLEPVALAADVSVGLSF